MHLQLFSFTGMQPTKIQTNTWTTNQWTQLFWPTILWLELCLVHWTLPMIWMKTMEDQKSTKISLKVAVIYCCVCMCVCVCVSVCVCVCVSFYLSISPSLSFLRLRKNCFRKPLGYAKTSTFPYWTQSRSWAYSQVSGLKYPSIKINLESLGMYKKKERYGELMEF